MVRLRKSTRTLLKNKFPFKNAPTARKIIADRYRRERSVKKEV